MATYPGDYAVPGLAWPGYTQPAAPVAAATPFPAAPSAYVVQQAAGSITAPDGIGTTAITTRDGSFLVLAAAWNTLVPGTVALIPAVSVTDSAGNLWQQAAISPAGSASARCAAWVTPNALPVTWVSAGLTGNAASMAWTVTEIAGMPQAVSLDFCAAASGDGSAPSLAWTASGDGIGFAVLAAGNTAGTAVSAPFGWAALGTATAGSGTAGVYAGTFWNTAVTAGSGVTPLTLGTASAWGYALCSLSSTASPPAQPSQSFPLVQVEAAFGAQPGDLSRGTDWLFSGDDYVPWTDISSRVIGPAVQARIRCSRGRQYQLQQEETGTAQIPLSNVDGAFTPGSPGSPYYSNALNSNMSFQSGVSPWTAEGASLAQSTAQSFASGLNASAVCSLKVTPDGVTGSPGAVSERVAVNANYPLTFSPWYNCPSGYAAGAVSEITWYAASGSLVSTASGTTAPLAAGVWTQVPVTVTAPPAGAAYAAGRLSLSGTAPSSAVYYAAEAALTAGTAVARTGLVAPLTPVRVTAWWQGRQYPVWAGFAQKWPQQWPQLPQWGFSGLAAADALGVAAAGQLQSALIGEVLTDSPYAYLPCNEMYTSLINGATPSDPYVFSGGYSAPADANGLGAVNRADGNQVAGVYLDGSAVQVSTGLAMNFLGDSGTGMGATGYSAAVTGQRGPSMLYSDPGLAAAVSGASGFTIEFWFTWNGSSSQQVTLLTVYGGVSSYPVFYSGSSQGSSIIVAIGTGNALSVTWQRSVYASVATVTPSQAPQHAVLVFSGSGDILTVYFNGSPFTISRPGASATQLNAIVLGPGRYSYDCYNSPAYYGYNVSAGHLAIYGYELPASRITAHYEAGAAGWSGVGAATRFAQLMTWGRLGLKRGGWSAASATGTAEITRTGPAYSLSGQSASAAVYSVAKSEGGRYGTQANGTLTYLERASRYNLPVSAVLADGTAPAGTILNPDPGFPAGTGGWTASAATVTYTPQNAYGGLGSLTVTPSGGTATVTSPAFTAPSGSAAAAFWVQVPAGGTVTCTAGAGTASAVVSPGAWSLIPVTVPAGTALSASLTASAGTAAFRLAWAAMWDAPGNVPYLPKSSYGFDMTYIYNEATATQQNGPNQLITYDARGSASQRQYFRRSALTFSPSVTSAYDVSDITTWSLARYQQPELHVATVTVDAASNPLQAFPTALSLDQGQCAQVSRSPVGGAPITETAITERVQHEIGPGYWHTSWQLSPYGPGQSVLAADTAGYDAPGTAPALILGW